MDSCSNQYDPWIIAICASVTPTLKQNARMECVEHLIRDYNDVGTDENNKDQSENGKSSIKNSPSSFISIERRVK